MSAYANSCYPDTELSWALTFTISAWSFVKSLCGLLSLTIPLSVLGLEPWPQGGLMWGVGRVGMVSSQLQASLTSAKKVPDGSTLSPVVTGSWIEIENPRKVAERVRPGQRCTPDQHPSGKGGHSEKKTISEKEKATWTSVDKTGQTSDKMYVYVSFGRISRNWEAEPCFWCPLCEAMAGTCRAAASLTRITF